MSPRTGRPPSEDPKSHETRIRMADGDIEKLNFCCDVLGISKSEVMRQGIDKMYQEAQKKK